MKTLEEYRADIDALDAEIVDLIAARFEIVKAVGSLKKREGIAVVQEGRAQAVKDRVAGLAAAKGLDSDLMRTIYTLMIDHAHVIEPEQ